MSRKEQFAENEFYHIYNRGTDKRTIFVDKADYDRFIRLLYVCNNAVSVVMKELRTFNFSQLTSAVSERTPLVAIGAYCLMPNHFHLLIKQVIRDGISMFMKKLLTAYAMYFNEKNDRSGGLFEGTFKSSRIKDDNYLKYLFAYIHLNPIKMVDSSWKEEGIKDMSRVSEYLKKYEYSSYLDFIGSHRPEGAIINRDSEVFPVYFENNFEFNDFIESWMNYKKDDI